jgi:WYL_2, Sm-like SH3 beta-barrel fold
MTMFTRDGLIDMLRNNIVTVTFTKVNGDERTMKCTLMAEYVPNAPTNNGQVLLQESESKAVSVWDTEANGWRSFRVDSVKSISMG